MTLHLSLVGCIHKIVPGDHVSLTCSGYMSTLWSQEIPPLPFRGRGVTVITNRMQDYTTVWQARNGDDLFSSKHLSVATDWLSDRNPSSIICWFWYHGYGTAFNVGNVWKLITSGMLNLFSKYYTQFTYDLCTTLTSIIEVGYQSRYRSLKMWTHNKVKRTVILLML